MQGMQQLVEGFSSFLPTAEPKPSKVVFDQAAGSFGMPIAREIIPGVEVWQHWNSNSNSLHTCFGQSPRLVQDSSKLLLAPAPEGRSDFEEIAKREGVDQETAYKVGGSRRDN
jgi:hypothetical protein